MKLLSLALCFCAHICLAQITNTVSGKVTDKATGNPVPYASVFLASTMTGDRAGEDGVFNLVNIHPGKYVLVVSSVGYKTLNIVIDLAKDQNDIQLAMVPDIKELKTVVVKSSNAEYLKQLKLFKQYFLGQTRNAGKCTIKNIDDIDFLYNEDKTKLTATSSKPIEIENAALGYRIFYLLEIFDLDFLAQKFTLSGQPRLELLRPESDASFTKERDRAYFGSLMHFMKSVSTSTVPQNNFALFTWRKPFFTREFDDVHKAHLDPRKPQWYPLRAVTLLNMRQDSLLKLLIVYKGGKQEDSYHALLSGLPQQSFITFLSHGLTIHENGYFDDPLAFFLDGYMGWKSKVIAELLPDEYEPALSAKQKTLMRKLGDADSLYRLKHPDE